MKNFSLTLTVVFHLCALTIVGQSIELKIELKNYKSDTIIVGNYYGDKQIVRDTLLSNDRSKFVWKEDKDVKPGMYLLLLKPMNNFAQFFLNGKDNKITMNVDANELSNISFKGSAENAAFYDYLRFLKDRRPESDTMRARIARAEAANITDEKSKTMLDRLDKEVKQHQKSLFEKFPSTGFSLLLSTSNDIVIPTFTGDEKDINIQRFKYYKSHFFDNIDLKNPSLIRTPFLHSKFDQYITKLTSQDPDSLIKAIDYLLPLIEHDADAYRYYLADFLNKYAQMKMVGQDAVYVHMVDNYYIKGKAPWLKEESLTKMKDNADELRPILINKIIPDITTYKQDSTAVRLHSIKSLYTVLIFWAPDCGHCKTIMPSIVKFYDNNKDKGVTILSVCTKGGDKTATCWPGVEEKGMQKFINTADEYGRYNQKIRVKSTPKIFILDENKKILIKDISGEDIEKIFSEIYKSDQNAKAEAVK